MKEFDENEICQGMYLHLLWSTLDQKNILPSPFPLLYNYLYELTLNEECHLIGGSVHSDHIQLVIKFTPYTVVSNLITNLKVGSLLWMRTIFLKIKNFEWQKSDISFTVGTDEVCDLIERIKNAKTFEEEVIILLDQNEIEYDLIEVFE